MNPEHPYVLEEVTVFAGEISSGIGAYTEFDSLQIALQAENSLSGILANTPGGSIRIGDRGEAQFSLRGAISRDTRLFIDGRPVASPWNGYIDFSGISMSDISQILIIKGPPPLKYGSSLGGAINIRTAAPTAIPITKFSAEYGSGDTYRTSITQSGKLGPVSMRIALSNEGRRGYPLSSHFSPTSDENGGLRDNSRNRRTTGVLTLCFPAVKGETTVSLGYSEEEREIPPSVFPIPPPRYWKFKDWTRYYADLRYDAEFGNWGYSSNFYYDVYTNRLKEYSDSSYDEDDYVYDSMHTSRVLGWDGGVKVDWGNGLSSDLGYRIHYDLFSRKEQTPSSGGFSDPEYHKTFHTEVYAEGVKRIDRTAELSLGLALLNRSEELDNPDSHFAPRLGFAVSPRENIRLALNLARSIQFPTFQHLYDTNSGNPELRPEKAWRIELGGRYFIDNRTSIAVWRYHSFIEGRIGRVDRWNPFLNLADTELWGEEVVFERRGVRNSFSIGVVHQKIKMDETCLSDCSLKGSDTPPWKIDCRYWVKLAERLSLVTSLTYLAEREDYNGNEIRDHTIIDLSARYNISDWWTINGRVENLLDQDYSQEYGFPQPGIMWKLGMTFTMENFDFGRK